MRNRHTRMIGFAIVLALFVADTARAATGDWVVQAAVGMEASDDVRAGAQLAVAVLRPAGPLVRVGVEGAWHAFSGGSHHFETSDSIEYGHSSAFTLLATSRFHVPARDGLLPYVIAEAGTGTLWLGTRAYRSESGILSAKRPSPGTRLLAVAGTGLGLRLVPAGRAPEVDLSVRASLWRALSGTFEDGEGAHGVGAVRLGVTW